MFGGCPQCGQSDVSLPARLRESEPEVRSWSPCLPAEMPSFTILTVSCSLVPLKAGCVAAACHVTATLIPAKLSRTFSGPETGQFPQSFAVHEPAADPSLLGDPGSAAPGPAAGHSLQGLHHSFPGTWPAHCPLTGMGTEASWPSTHTHF